MGPHRVRGPDSGIKQTPAWGLLAHGQAAQSLLMIRSPRTLRCTCFDGLPYSLYWYTLDADVGRLKSRTHNRGCQSTRPLVTSES